MSDKRPQTSDLRVRLTNAHDPKEVYSILESIALLGDDATLLLPDLLASMDRGLYLPPAPLVPIIALTKSEQLLKSAIGQDQWVPDTLQRCELLKAGFVAFEGGILKDLYRMFERDDDPRRSVILNALSVSGTSKALETLEVIEARTRERVAALKSPTSPRDMGSFAAMLQAAEYLPAKESFLKQLQNLILVIRNRSTDESKEIQDVHKQSKASVYFLPDQNSGSDTSGTVQALAEEEVAHVLFIDIVGFSKLRMHDQQRVHKELTTLINGVDEVVRSKNEDQLITLPTGDGIALVFFRGLRRHVDAAIAIAKSLQKNKTMEVRMGLHTGPVQRVVDVNRNANVVGPGINIAQRVMDCGDGGHILLSKEVAEVLTEIGGFDELLADMGPTKVKHDKVVHLYNLSGEGFGNSSGPSKLSAENKVATRTALSPTVAKDHSIQVLLTASNERAIIVPAERIVQGDTLTLSLIPSDEGDLSFLHDLRSKSSELIGIAYGYRGMHAQVRSLSSLLEHGKDVWTLDVKPFDSDYRGGGLAEVACGNFSADDIAVLRARRILLDEELPGYSASYDDTSQRLNNAMLEAFVQGINTQVKIKGSMIPILFQGSAGNIPSFLVAARLYSVLWLHVSGVVDHIAELEMKMVGESELAVTFEGRRPRTYVNVEPSVIKVEGTCNLVK